MINRRMAGLSALCGIAAGLSTAFFLYALNFVTQTRQEHTWLIFGLPLAGLVIGWLYTYYDRENHLNNSLIIDEIHSPKNVLPARMSPLIFLSTLLTHLFGGSAGREGTAVQMGASLSDQIGRYFQISQDERKILLLSGTGAGFAAALGTPLAGILFGMEVVRIGRFQPAAILESTIASFVAYYVCILVRAPHSYFAPVDIVHFDFRTAFYVALAGILFGLAAKYFILFTHYLEFRLSQLVRSKLWRPFVGGLILVALYHYEGSYRFTGLGIEWIQRSLEETTNPLFPALKAVFTSITLASGFKGGEFIPLVFIGTTLGSALSLAFPIGLGLMASVGFAAVFGAAANAPLACAVMAAEIFGVSLLPYSLIGCFMAYFFSGQNSIYKSQRRGPKLWIWKRKKKEQA